MEVVKVLNKSNTELVVICGEEDEDCLPLAKQLVQSAREVELNVKAHWIKDTNHEYPPNLKQLI